MSERYPDIQEEVSVACEMAEEVRRGSKYIAYVYRSDKLVAVSSNMFQTTALVY